MIYRVVSAALWKKSAYALQLLLAPFESKELYTLQMGARGECLAYLLLNTPLYPDQRRIYMVGGLGPRRGGRPNVRIQNIQVGDDRWSH